MRILVVNNLLFNRRLVVKYIKSKENSVADNLSRGKIREFKKEVKIQVNKLPDQVPDFIWPPQKLWQY